MGPPGSAPSVPPSDRAVQSRLAAARGRPYRSGTGGGRRAAAAGRRNRSRAGTAERRRRATRHEPSRRRSSSSAVPCETPVFRRDSSARPAARPPALPPNEIAAAPLPRIERPEGVIADRATPTRALRAPPPPRPTGGRPRGPARPSRRPRRPLSPPCRPGARRETARPRSTPPSARPAAAPRSRPTARSALARRVEAVRRVERVGLEAGHSRERLDERWSEATRPRHEPVRLSATGRERAQAGLSSPPTLSRARGRTSRAPT